MRHSQAIQRPNYSQRTGTQLEYRDETGWIVVHLQLFQWSEKLSKTKLLQIIYVFLFDDFFYQILN